MRGDKRSDSIFRGRPYVSSRTQLLDNMAIVYSGYAERCGTHPRNSEKTINLKDYLLNLSHAPYDMGCERCASTDKLHEPIINVGCCARYG